MTSAATRRRQRVELTAHGQAQIAALSAPHREELRRFRDEMGDILDELG